MKPVALDNPEISEALLDLETGLAIARTLYTNYFEKVGESAQRYFEGSRNDSRIGGSCNRLYAIYTSYPRGNRRGERGSQSQ